MNRQYGTDPEDYGVNYRARCDAMGDRIFALENALRDLLNASTAKEGEFGDLLDAENAARELLEGK